MTHVFGMVVGTLALGAVAAGASSSQAPATAETQALATASAPPQSPPPHICFNFAKATTFRAVDDDTIRLSTSDAGDFDIDLTGPQCTGLKVRKDITIKSAPAFNICPETSRKMDLSFQDKSEILKCSIARVKRTESTPPAADPKLQPQSSTPQ